MSGPAIPNPPVGGCSPGKLLVLGVVCNASGEAYGDPDWHDPTEGSGFAANEPSTVGFSFKPCGGCQSDPVAIIKAMVEAMKAGYEMGRAVLNK